MRSLVKVLVGVGSNLQQPIQQVRKALQALTALDNATVLACSSLYSSQPQGPQDQEDYVNAAALLETSLSPVELLSALQNIEQEFGRIKTRHWGERIIDLDILFYGQQEICLTQPDLHIPHREVLNRDFAVVPAIEICPDWRLPNGSPLSDVVLSSQKFVLKKLSY